MRSFRVLVILLGLILLLPAIPLVTRSSVSSAYDTGLILGRYSPEYFALLVSYGLMLAGLVGIAVRAPQRLRDLILRPVRWLQAHPLVLGILLYSFVEVWFLVKGSRPLKRFFDHSDLVLIRVAVALLEVYVAGVLLLAGREPANRRNVATNIGLLIISSAIVLVLFAYGYALIVRQEDYVRRHRIWTEFHRPDPALAYTIRPNQTDFLFHLVEEDAFIPASTDAYGFRNDVDIADAPVAGLGDSMTFGLFVRNDELWSVALGEELGVPVANYGVMGYSIWQYNVLADRTLRQADHQVVLYGIFANDLSGPPEVDQDFVRGVRRIQLWRWRSPINFAIYEFLDESPGNKIVEALTKGPKRDTGDFVDEAAGQPNEIGERCVPWAIGYNQASLPIHLDRAIELSDDIGYELVFVLIPSKESVYSEEMMPLCSERASKALENEWAAYAQICEHVEAQGSLCYDMTADMRAAADEEGLLNFRLDGHWTPLGHQVYARLLADYVRAHDLLAE